MNDILEVYHFNLLKQFLEKKVKKFKAGSIRPCLEKWKLITSDPEVLQKVSHIPITPTYSKFSILIKAKWNNFYWKRTGVLTTKEANCPIWIRTGRICLTSICKGKKRCGLQIHFKLEEVQWESRIQKMLQKLSNYLWLLEL